MDSKIWSGCNGRASITPKVGENIYILFPDTLSWKVWILKAKVLTSALCWLYRSKTTCRAVQTTIVDSSTCLPWLFLLVGAASYSNVSFWWLSVDRMATEWECKEATLCLDENMPRRNLSRSDVPRSISTGRLVTTQIHTLTRADVKMYRTSIYRGCLLAVRSFGNDSRWMRRFRECGMGVLFARFISAPVFRRPCMMCKEWGSSSKRVLEMLCWFGAYSDFGYVCWKWKCSR